LPTAPRRRPMFVVAAALLGLGGILLILSLVNPNPGPPPLLPGAKGRASNDKPLNPDPRSKGTTVPTVAAADQDLQKLQQAFASTEPKTTVQLARNVDIGDKTLEFDNTGELIVESDDIQELRTISMKYPGGKTPWTGLFVKHGKVTFRNIKFEVQA